MSGLESQQYERDMGAALCPARSGKHPRLCEEGGGENLPNKVRRLVAEYQKTKMEPNNNGNNKYAYFFYDPNHPYFHVGAYLTPNHRENWPGPGSAPERMTQDMIDELDTYAKILTRMKTDVITPATGNTSMWLKARDKFNIDHFYIRAPLFQDVLSNYMILKLEGTPEFEALTPADPPGLRIPVCPNTNKILGTFVPEITCAVQATNQGLGAESTPCDPAPPDDTLAIPSDDTRDMVEIPTLMLWGVMRGERRARPPWRMTLALAKMAKWAGRIRPGVLGGPPSTWGTVNEGGAWHNFNPRFRQLLEAGINYDNKNSKPVVSCCYDDDVTDCSQFDNNRQMCITRPNCTYKVDTNKCLQGTYTHSCANVNCENGRVAFSEHLIEEDKRKCCRSNVNKSCTPGMSFSECISEDHCTWDQGDAVNRPRCRTRHCTKEDCGGEEVTASVSGTAPGCQCTCKDPAVGKNFCYIAGGNCPVSKLKDVCGSARRASPGNCQVCVQHYPMFRTCHDMVDKFCNSDPDPTVPPGIHFCGNPESLYYGHNGKGIALWDEQKQNCARLPNSLSLNGPDNWCGIRTHDECTNIQNQEVCSKAYTIADDKQIDEWNNTQFLKSHRQLVKGDALKCQWEDGKCKAPIPSSGHEWDDWKPTATAKVVDYVCPACPKGTCRVNITFNSKNIHPLLCAKQNGECPTGYTKI